MKTPGTNQEVAKASIAKDHTVTRDQPKTKNKIILRIRYCPGSVHFGTAAFHIKAFLWYLREIVFINV